MSARAVPAKCSACGAELAGSIPTGLCPKCLLRMGLPTEPGEPPPLDAAIQRSADRAHTLPQPGDRLGHYRVVRLLGEGGMGAVFEAEDLETDRRVALKVLGHSLDSPEARARFLREGRLAASINHPNSVYVYGTEEIGGIPVIAMELVAGGTLQDRVRRDGHLPFTEAVDSLLQVIAGLEAAQRVGVLHRDIKPSNCFLEANGTVKIGDFGLSISSAVRAEPTLTTSGAFLGTPAFSSPEQLRGDELTVRSDIYAAGVTLYYLLTGRRPFEAANLPQLLATVLERQPPPPNRWQPGIPQGLSRVVLRCLEKDPGERYANYAELRAALQPFSSIVPTPASLGLRFLAGCIDSLLMGAPHSLLVLILFGGPAAMTRPETFSGPKALWMWFGSLVMVVVYYGLLEGLVGAAAGKAICGLRVARLDRNRPGVWRAGWRALLFVGLPGLPALALWVLNPSWIPTHATDWRVTLVSLAPFALIALLFSSARRRNGFAAWQDFASQTRVVTKSAFSRRPGLKVGEETLPDVATAPLIGPYHVLDRLASTNSVEWSLGFDGRLLRRVWIRRLLPGTPPVPSSLRNLGRPGRLRWLQGKRGDTEAWDAYEAVSGQPLLRLLTERQSWSQVRYWALDLAEELQAAAADGSRPAVLGIDRIWVTTEGRLKLLDFPAPGVGGPASVSTNVAEPNAATGPEFLRQVIVSALEGRPVGLDESRGVTPRVPLPLPVREFVGTLSRETPLTEATRGLRSLLSRPASVSRPRRLGLFAGSIALPLLGLSVGMVSFVWSQRFLEAHPDLRTLQECLVHYDQLDRQARKGESAGVAERQAFEIYIAGRFRAAITNTAVWAALPAQMAIPNPLRQQAERIIATIPPPSAAAFDDAQAIVQRHFRQPPEEAAREALRQVTALAIAFVLGYVNPVILVVIPCLFASLLFRGGVLVHALRLAFVRPDGSRCSRGRVTWRNFLAWLPFLLLPANILTLAILLGTTGAVLLVSAVTAAITVTSLLLRDRGLADRLAGTWLVPK